MNNTPLPIYFNEKINIINNIYKNKFLCYRLNNCILDLREFSLHNEHQQSHNLKLYSNGIRVKKYINRNPETNALWYAEENSTFELEQEIIDVSKMSINYSVKKMFFCYDYLEWQYSHFLTDVYPKMLYYPKLKDMINDVKFGQIRPIVNFAPNVSDKTLSTKLNLVSDFAHDITDFYLNHNSCEDDLYPLSSGKVYFIEELYVPVPFTSQDVLSWPIEQYKMYDLLKTESIKRITKKFPERIFISRKDIMGGWFNLRYCVNEDEISNELNNLGFETIELMPLNIFEKIKVFSDAKEIVQSVGSNCFNVVFVNENTKLFTFVHPYYTCWSPMLNSLAIQYKSKYIPIEKDIEMLGTDDYPKEYVRKPDQPWKLNNVFNLKNIINNTIW